MTKTQTPTRKAKRPTTTRETARTGHELPAFAQPVTPALRNAVLQLAEYLASEARRREVALALGRDMACAVLEDGLVARRTGEKPVGLASAVRLVEVQSLALDLNRAVDRLAELVDRLERVSSEA